MSIERRLHGTPDVAYRVEGTLKLEFHSRGELPRWDDDSENYWFLDAKVTVLRVLRRAQVP
jgi:hypothetical protein